ncbi:MAG TPA: GAF domain-containing protein, partial [Candidatus Binataceae bacterium]|nr:GAF domain-containing protein [Candidatus Binataceae bacterium]
SLEIHKATVVQVDPTDGQLKATHQWVQKDAIIPNNLATATADYPWLRAKILSGEVVVLEDHKDAPAAAFKDLEQAQKHGGKASVSIPLRIGGAIAGAVVFTSATMRSWPSSTIQQLERITGIFGFALAATIAGPYPKAAGGKPECSSGCTDGGTNDFAGP